MNYTESIQKITRAIVNEIYKKDCSDKTFKAKVTEIVSPDKVRVLYSGNTYTVFTSIYCELNDMVMVCAPCNNWQELYVLQNRTKGRTLRDIYSESKLFHIPPLNISDSIIGTIASTYEVPSRRTYITTNNPISDSNYLFSGTSYTIIGMEYNNYEYGYQKIFGIGGEKIRSKSKGIWSDWKSTATDSDISTVVNRTLYEQQVAANRQKTFIVNGDANTYYPVVVTGYENGNKWPNMLCLGKSLGSKTASYTGNHSNGTSSINCGWLFRNGGWDGNGNFVKSLYKLQNYASLLSHTDMITGSVSCFVLWLRGGGTEYTITMSTRFNVNVYYSTTNLGSAQYPHNVASRTDVGNAGIINTSGVDF